MFDHSCRKTLISGPGWNILTHFPIKIQSQAWLQVFLDLAHQNYAITPYYQFLLTYCFLKTFNLQHQYCSQVFNSEKLVI